MFYKNCSYSAKTFYGVTFQPGETKKVGGIINNKWMVPVDDSATVTKSPQKEPSSEIPKVEPSPEKPVTPKEDIKVEESTELEVQKDDNKHSGKGKKS